LSNNFYTDGEAGGEFACTIEFLISTEVFVEAARTGLGLTVTGGDIDDLIASPPAHRVDGLAALQANEGLSEDGFRAQVRRWALADRVVDARLGAEGAEVRPSASMSLAANDAEVNAWVAELVDSGDIAEVVVDPLFASWSTTDLSSRDACVSAVLARIGDATITAADVSGLNDAEFPPSQGQLDFQLQFLISSEIYVQGAAERLGVVVSDETVDAFIQNPPAHRLTDLAGLISSGQFTVEGVRAQVRRWQVADEAVAVLILDDAEFLDELAASTGLTIEEITADPLSFLQADDVSRVFNSWTTEIAEQLGFPEVVMDPLVGEWDPVFRQFTPAGG
jgi:hypothetical protein